MEEFVYIIIQTFRNNKDTQENIEREIELTKEKFVFCYHALENFTKGNPNDKKEVLADLGSNRQIQDKKVLISLHKWLLPIYANAETHNQKLARLEPDIYGYDYNKNEALNELRLSWRCVINVIRTEANFQ